MSLLCQQALEKLSKGLYNFYIDDNVPKIHNISFILAKVESSLSLTVKPEIYDLLDTLSSHYLNNRYPDFTTPPNIHIDKSKATDLIERTKEAFIWLLTLKK